MFEKLKKKSFKKSLWGTALFLAMGIYIVALTANNFYYTVTGYADFEQLAPEEIKNQLVTFDMTTNFGCYMEKSEKNSKIGSKITTDLYYIVWTGDENATDFRYMTVKVPAELEQEMEAMADNSYNEMPSDPISVHGKIEKLSDEEYQYFIDYFQEAGWTEQEIEEGTLPYYINAYDSKAFSDFSFTLLFVCGVLSIIWAVVRVIKGAKGGFLNKLHEDIARAGYTESSIESDYNHAISMTKDNSVKIGSLMFYYEAGAVVRAIPVNKISWAYQNATTHRTNGIKTGTSYTIMIYAEDTKNVANISVSKESVSQEILSKISTMFPWVVVGYSADLSKLYTKNRAEFLNLRYNTCEHITVEPGFEDFTGSDSTAQ